MVAVGDLMERRRNRDRPRVVVRHAADGSVVTTRVYSALVHLPLFDTFSHGKSRQVRVLEWTGPAEGAPSRYLTTSFTTGAPDEVLPLLMAPYNQQRTTDSRHGFMRTFWTPTSDNHSSDS